MAEQQRTIYVWAEDKPGVLIRVANVVAAKGANIHRLTASPDPLRIGISKIMLVATLGAHLHGRVVAEINRIVTVLIAIDVTDQHRSPAAGSTVPEASFSC